MRNVFNATNPVMLFIGRIFDAAVLSIVWLILCIPVITFGPATIALHYTLMKDVKDEAPHFLRVYFKAFKENLRNGIPLGLILEIFGGLSIYALYFYGNQTTMVWTILKWLLVGLMIIYACVLQYVFAISSRFVNTTGATIRNTIYISIRNLPWTIAMLMIMFVVLWIIYLTECIPLIPLAYGLIVYMDAPILNRIIDPLVKKTLEQEGKTEETYDDEEGRYTAEELAAASRWTAPAEEPEEKNTDKAADTAVKDMVSENETGEGEKLPEDEKHD